MNGMPKAPKVPPCVVAVFVQNSAKPKKGMPNRNVERPFLRAYCRGMGLSDQSCFSPESRLIVMRRPFAPVLGAFLLHIGEVLVEHDAVLAGERDEAFAAG